MSARPPSPDFHTKRTVGGFFCSKAIRRQSHTAMNCELKIPYETLTKLLLLCKLYWYQLDGRDIFYHRKGVLLLITLPIPLGLQRLFLTTEITALGWSKVQVSSKNSSNPTPILAVTPGNQQGDELTTLALGPALHQSHFPTCTFVENGWPLYTYKKVQHKHSNFCFCFFYFRK